MLVVVSYPRVFLSKAILINLSSGEWTLEAYTACRLLYPMCEIEVCTHSMIS